MNDQLQHTKSHSTDLSFGKSFYRYNVSAILATAVDFIVLSILNLGLGVNYVVATALGALAGAIVAFLLGRNWAFVNKEGKITTQAIKFLTTSFVSMLLNTGGVVFLIEVIGIKHILTAKLITSLAVGIFFNFPMQKYFVYQKKKPLKP